MNPLQRVTTAAFLTFALHAAIAGAVPGEVERIDGCENAMVGLKHYPEIPKNLTDRGQLALYSRQLNSVIGHNTGHLGRSLTEVNTRDKAFRELRALSGDAESGGHSFFTAFSNFADVVDEAAPPAEFSASEVVVQSGSMLRRAVGFVAEKTGVAKHLPPTVEQWLNIFAKKAPDIQRAYDQIKRTIDDLHERKEATHQEIYANELVINELEVQSLEYGRQIDAIEEQLRTQEIISGAELREIQSRCLYPLMRNQKRVNDQIGLARGQVLQRFKYLDEVLPVVENMAFDATLKLPTIIAQAIMLEDTVLLRNAALVSPSIDEAVRKGFKATNAALRETDRLTTLAMNSSPLTPQEMAKDLVDTVRRRRDAQADALPALRKARREFEAFNKQLQDETAKYADLQPLLEHQSGVIEQQ